MSEGACDRCGRSYLLLDRGGLLCLECGRNYRGQVWRLPKPEPFNGDTTTSRARLKSLVSAYRGDWEMPHD